MKSLKLYTACAVVVGAVTLWVLPLPPGAKPFIAVVLSFCAVFVFVEATGRGRVFAVLTIAALTFYLFLSIQRGWLLLQYPTVASVLLGIGMVVLPALGTWAMVREIIFGARVQRLAHEMAVAGALPEDCLPRSASGRIDRRVADEEFERFRVPLEENPSDWKNWFNISTLYGQAGDRKRARKSMRIAIDLHRGKDPQDMSV